MRIGSCHVGPDHPVYVIAELGVNHDGRVDRALELVEAAASAGASAIKLQCFQARRLLSQAGELAAYQRDAGEQDAAEMLSRLELTMEELARVAVAAHHAGVHAIVTVFSAELVPGVLAAGPWDALKSASPDIVHRDLLTAMASSGLPLIVSTGASSLSEVARAVDWLRPWRDRLALLQCVSCYPTAEADASIGGVLAIGDCWLGPIGYSDHTTGIQAGAVACAVGACILEKHLTYCRGAKGPDHSASIDPREFREYVRLAREACSARRGGAHWTDTRHAGDVRIGPASKSVLPCEADVRRLSRQSVVAARAIPSGAEISRADLTIKRPGTGLEPWRMGGVVGRQASRCIEADRPIVEGDLA